jgi:hypothetical protein
MQIVADWLSETKKEPNNFGSLNDHAYEISSVCNLILAN